MEVTTFQFALTCVLPLQPLTPTPVPSVQLSSKVTTQYKTQTLRTNATTTTKKN